MKALITGTTGLLGVHLIQELQRRELGYEPKVDIQEGIRLSASWFNARAQQQPCVASPVNTPTTH